MSTTHMEKVTALLHTSAPDLAGDPAEIRGVYRAMLTAAPLPPDVRTEPADLGRTSALRLWIEGTSPTATILHVFQAFAAVLDEGRDALDRAGMFLRARLAGM